MSSDDRALSRPAGSSPDATVPDEGDAAVDALDAPASLDSGRLGADRASSPGRYSLATDASERTEYLRDERGERVGRAAVRIDSTRMQAVRPPESAGFRSPFASPFSAPAAPKSETQPTSSSRERLPPLSARDPLGPPPIPDALARRATLTNVKLGSLPPPTPLPPPVAETDVEVEVVAIADDAAEMPAYSDDAFGAGDPFFEGFDEGSIAHAFDALMGDGPIAGPAMGEVDLGPVRELFAELAANHMRHVRDFMIDVKWGEAAREWVEICVPAVRSLERAAERLEIGDLSVALRGFAQALQDLAGGSSRMLTAEDKAMLLASYDRLAEALPQAFALDRDTSQREAVIVQSLLLSVPDVRKVTIDKLHAAGLTSLPVLFAARADEVAQVAGITVALATRIVDRFQSYRREMSTASLSDARAAEREKLAELLHQLRAHHQGYEDQQDAWQAEAKARKRVCFRAREEAWLAISVLLARFGEVERLAGIERVPFARRIALLSEYLEEARDKYRVEPV